jgi:transposase
VRVLARGPRRPALPTWPTTNLFAALDVGTGQVLADCYPRRTGADFLAFIKKAVKPHAGKEIHVVLDNLSTHDTPEVNAWLARHPNVTLHFTPVGSSWINQIVRHEAA